MDQILRDNNELKLENLKLADTQYATLLSLITDPTYNLAKVMDYMKLNKVELDTFEENMRHSNNISFWIIHMIECDGP